LSIYKQGAPAIIADSDCTPAAANVIVAPTSVRLRCIDAGDSCALALRNNTAALDVVCHNCGE